MCLLLECNQSPVILLMVHHKYYMFVLLIFRIIIFNIILNKFLIVLTCFQTLFKAISIVHIKKFIPLLGKFIGIIATYIMI